MICGAGSLPHEHDDEPSSTPKKGKQQQQQQQQNPYSTRGLDKFSTVLAELGAKRERIMAKTGSQGVALVQFVYHNSKDWVPIVVRPKPDKKQPLLTSASSTQTTLPTADKQDQSKDVVAAAAAATMTTTTKKATERRKVTCRRRLYSWRPSYYWPSVLVLILVCLVMFGRVFAICCTSIWWYMLPTLKDWNIGEDAKKKKKMVMRKKKEYGRKLSDKRLTTPPPSQAKKA